MFNKKKAAALLIGAMLTVNSMGMVFADGDGSEPRPLPANKADNPAVVLEVDPSITTTPEEELMFTTQVLTVSENDPMLKKQAEIVQYLFVDYKDAIAENGFMVTHTVVVGEQVEIGIRPYSETSAEYLYGVFGRDQIAVVDGQAADVMMVALGTPEYSLKNAEANPASFFSIIWEWIVNLFR